MITVFYITVIISILFEFANIKKCNKISVDDFEKALKKEHKGSINIYNLWILIGFLSSQWALFIGLFIISLIPRQNLFLSVLISYLNTVLLLSILINKYNTNYTFF